MFHRPNMLKQERHILQHVDILIEKLQKYGKQRKEERAETMDDNCEGDGAELGFWFMAFATDVITDLAFGEAFGSLKEGKCFCIS